MYTPIQAEDNAVEKWVSRNRFWSTSERTEKRYINWLDEAHALNAVSYGIKAELDWTGKWIPGMDTIKMHVEIPQFDPQLGAYRYRMIATLNGTEIEIYNRNSSKIERGPIFWTGKLMLIYQLVRRVHEMHTSPYFHGRI